MDADKWEAGYFNQQIVLAVQSLGFEEPDVNFTRDALDATFTHRCSPPATVIPASAGDQLQSICVAPNCPLDPHANCSAYPDNGFVAQPAIANVTLLDGVPKENETEAAATTPAGSSTPSSSSSSTGSAAIASHTTNGASYTFVHGNTMAALGFVVALGAGVFAFPL